MALLKEDAYLHILCVDLTTDRFQFSILNSKTKKSIHAQTFDLSNFDKSNVEELLKLEMFSFQFENVIVSYGGARSTLIPVDLFSHSKPSEVFRLNYPEPIDNLDYNRIPELGIVSIYEMPLWIKSLFVIKFPRCKIVHRSTVLLKGIFDQPTFSPKLHINIEKDHFYLLITKKMKLDYYNRFDYSVIADLIYYVLFVLEQKEYDQADFELNLYGVPSDWEELESFKSFFNCKIKISDSTEGAEEFIRAKQLLCV